MEVRIQRLEATRVAARVHEGPYEGLAGVIDGLVRWLRTHKESGGAITTVFADPHALEAGLLDEQRPEAHTTQVNAHEDGPSIQAEVWLPALNPSLVDAAAKEDDIHVKDTPGVDAACVTHTGDPLAIPHMALALRGFLQQQGYQIAPETRIVHLMPDWENPSQWVAEVQIPVTAKPER